MTSPRSDVDLMFELRASHIMYTRALRIVPGERHVRPEVYNRVGFDAMQSVIAEQVKKNGRHDEEYTKKETMRRLGLLYDEKFVKKDQQERGVLA